MSAAIDRIQELASQNEFTGIDFIFVHPDFVLTTDPEYHHPNQVKVDIHFHQPAPSTLNSPLNSSGTDGLTLNEIKILNANGGSELEQVPVTSMSWMGEILRLQTRLSSDFALFNLFIDDPDRIDRYFNNITFRFNANCRTDLDCDSPKQDCPPDKIVDFPVNYLARDFWSFRKALFDFASVRYPDWKDRLEADAGVMLIELMSGLGDEMAYYQDRIAREAYLETASQRRSIRNHTKLIDYRIHDGRGASTWLDITVTSGMSGNLEAGMEVWASSDNGRKLSFEIGLGLEDIFSEKVFPVAAVRNSFAAHCWDENDTCLAIGSTQLYISGHHAANLPFDDFGVPPYNIPGKWVLLLTHPDPSLPVRTHLVRLIKITDTTDPLSTQQDITHLVWEEEQATIYEMDMRVLEVRGNIVPVTSGRTHSHLFVVGAPITSLPINGQKEMSRALERLGRDGRTTYFFTLSLTENAFLIRFGANLRETKPDIHLQEMEWDGAAWQPTVPVRPWIPRPSLIGIYSAQASSRDYVLDDGSWKRVVGYQRSGGEIVHEDYASNQGVTIRFGDGEFGMSPPAGTVFRVDYRVGDGRRDNVAAHSLRHFTDTGFIDAVDNPFPAINGADAETEKEVRQMAPEAYREVTYRAVRPEDYAEAVERLDSVQKAGATFRWTGSWSTAFVTPDPVGAVVLKTELRNSIDQQLDRFRQAGREAFVKDPVYADIDLVISVCVNSDSYRGEVKKLVLEALIGKTGIRPKIGYFSPDRFTFGTPLDRSTLEDAIQSVPGVKAVKTIFFSRRSWFSLRQFREFKYQPGLNTIIRIENNPVHPERGTIKLKMEGGA